MTTLTAEIPAIRSARAWVPIILWAALWLNLNTGPWLINETAPLANPVAFARVFAPVAVLVAALALLRGSVRLSVVGSPVALLAIYGLVALFAGILSPSPEWALYWSVAFLATLAVCGAVLTSAESAGGAAVFLWSTWIATAIVAVGVSWRGGDLIFGSSGSAYGIDVMLRGQIISSGAARWAAVAAFVALTRSLFAGSWLVRIPLLAAAGAGLFVVYRMQSRGAVFGSVAAFLFLLYLSRRFRGFVLPLLVVAIMAMIVQEALGGAGNAIFDYLKRGGSDENLYSMTGRTWYYSLGWTAFLDAPLIGRGQWADRLLGIGHIHNSYLQALLNAGIVGSLPYFLSWLAGWSLFFRLWRRHEALPFYHRVSLVECGAVMMFFTLRSIPETTTASYAPDILIMGAVYTYMECLALAGFPAPGSVSFGRSLPGRFSRFLTGFRPNPTNA